MEQRYNAEVVKQIRETYPEVDVYLPQEQADINDKSQYADSKMIAQYDTDAVMASDLLIAVLDGLTIDAGVASEIGIAYANDIPVLGLFTDPRQSGADVPEKLEALNEIAESQFPYVNLYTVGLIKLNGEIVNSEEKLVEKIEKYI